MTFSWRPHQLEALTSIRQAIDRGVHNIVLEAPVGSGKSKILQELATGLYADRQWTSYYTTPQVLLVDQIHDDPLLHDHVTTLYGKSNYPCVMPELPDVNVLSRAEGWCETGLPCPTCAGSGHLVDKDGFGIPCKACKAKGTISKGKKECPKFEVCPYEVARARALLHHLPVMTFAYFALATKSAELGGFIPRDLLIIDEAHGLAEAAVQGLGIDLRPKLVRGSEVYDSWWDSYALPLITNEENTGSFEAFTNEHILPILRSVSGAVALAYKEVAGLPLAPDEDVGKKQRRLNRIKNLMSSIDEAARSVKNSSAEWVIQHERDHRNVSHLKFSPVTATEHLRNTIWKLAPVRILSSGTILDRDHYLADLGLDPTDSVLIQQPSSFPPSQCPILFHPNAISLAKETKEANLPRALLCLEEILRRYPDTRGIIHGHTFVNQRYIQEHLPEDLRQRLITHTPDDRNEVLERFLTSSPPNAVLNSVAMTEGLDLKDDRARFQVVFKCPWPYLGDRRIRRRKRLPDGSTWYMLQALRSILQASGRIMRSPTDWGDTWITDSSARDLLYGKWGLLPADVKARIRAGEERPW
ncbi:MAG: hypothetical protein KGI89_14965 [Euryarchaeota archaeon]|nr:hypothetical protein [Euryarchaeota archaeon]